MTAEAVPLLKSKEKYVAPDLAGYSVADLELLFSLSYQVGKNASVERRRTAELAQAYKRKTLAPRLATLFENNSKNTLRNKSKADSYKAAAGIISKPPKQGFFKEEYVYRGHAWAYTGVRLFIVRLNRILAKLGHSFVPPFFSVLGLSYIVTFLFDMFIVLKATFIPEPSPEEEARLAAEKQYYGFWKWAWLSLKNIFERILKDTWKERWIRCKNSILEGDRPYRLANDLVWSLVNLIVFCTAGPLYLLLNPILNLIGFAFDTGHEFFWLGRDTQKHMRLMKKLSTQIQDLENNLKDNPNNTEIKVEIEKLKFMREQIKLKRNEIIRRRLWISVCTAFVLIGMILVYFPPTTIPGAFFIGAGLALVAGSVFTGLGRRLYLTAETYFPKLVGKFKKWRESKTSTAVAPEVTPEPITSTAKVAVALTIEPQIAAPAPIPIPPLPQAPDELKQPSLPSNKEVDQLAKKVEIQPLNASSSPILAPVAKRISPLVSPNTSRNVTPTNSTDELPSVFDPSINLRDLFENTEKEASNRIQRSPTRLPRKTSDPSIVNLSDLFKNTDQEASETQSRLTPIQREMSPQ